MILRVRIDNKDAHEWIYRGFLDVFGSTLTDWTRICGEPDSLLLKKINKLLYVAIVSPYNLNFLPLCHFI